MRFIRKGSLAGKICLTMCLVALVPLVIMAMQGLHCSRQAIIELEETHLKSILVSRKARLDAWLMERENDLKFSCFMSCGSDGCTGMAGHMSAEHFESIRKTMDLFELRNPLYESMAIYNESWQQISRKRPSINHGHQALLDRVLQEKLKSATGLVASATHPHEDGHIGLHMGYPLGERSKTHLGYIVVNVDMADTLQEILMDPSGLGESGKLYLLSSDGEYLIHPSSRAEHLGMVADIPAILLSGNEPSVILFKDVNGTKVLGTSVRIPEFDWFLVVEVNESEALGWLSMLHKRALATGLVTFIAVLILAVRFSGSLAKPLRALAATARQIAGGAYYERVGDFRENEVQDVGRAFNEMLDTLSEAQQKVVQSASLAAIGELSASVVHEMRNPLTSIKLNLQALGKKVEGDRAYEELASIASEQALRLERMLTELLNYGKKIILSPVTLSFSELTEEAVAGLRDIAGDKKVTLTVVDKLNGRPLHVDREQMRRVLVNLVENAFFASPVNSEVRIEASEIAGAKPLVEISVCDQGHGISESILEKLFQPFVTTRDKGTGLGFANVKKIVELHAGSVFASNSDDGGALFRIQLPLRIADL